MNAYVRTTYKTDYAVGLNHRDYTAIDIETTGLKPETDEIIELAAVRYRNGNEVDRFQSLVKPKGSISDFIEKLTGINDAMVSDAPGIADILPSYLLFLGDDILLGHNIKFDMGFIDEAAESLDLELPSNKWNDTMLLSRDIFKGERSHKLKDLCSRLDIPKLEEHRALSDCIRTHLCYEAMKKYQNKISSSEEGTYNDAEPCSTIFDEKTIQSLNDTAFNNYLLGYCAYVKSLSADDHRMIEAICQISILKREHERRFNAIGWDEEKIKSFEYLDLVSYSKMFTDYAIGYSALSGSVIKEKGNEHVIYSSEEIEDIIAKVEENNNHLEFLNQEMNRRRKRIESSKEISTSSPSLVIKSKQSNSTASPATNQTNWFLSLGAFIIGVVLAVVGLGLSFFDHILPGAAAFGIGAVLLIVSYFNQ